MGSRRVCVVWPQVPYLRGGAEIHADLTVEALAREGFEVESVSVPYTWMPDRTALEQALAWRLIDLQTEFAGIDLVIATKFPSYLVRHRNKVAWIFHQQRELYDLHGTPFGPFSDGPEDQSLRQALVDLDLQALGEARALFANSQNVADRLERYCGMKARALYAPPKLHDVLRPGPYGDYLLYVGRLDPIKRVDLTLRALADADRGVRLRIAGKGPHRGELERLAGELGVDDRVEFLGFVSDEEVVELYSGCFAVLLTPHDEDYGFTTLEAMFAGKPVVTTDDGGGVLEFVEDGVTGFAVPPDPERLAERVDELYRDRALCERLGGAGRESVREKVQWRIAIDALTATLD